MNARADALRPRTWLATGLAAGLATGLLEALVLLLRRVGFGELIHVSAQFGWMAPVGDLVLFLPPALLIAGLARLRPGLMPVRFGLAIFIWLGASALLFLIPGFSRPAALLLAAGIGWQGGRLLGGSAAAVERRALPALAVLLTLVLLIAGSSLGLAWWRERRALARLPAPPAGHPNVLLLILDTVRADHLSLYGYGRETTPELEKLALRGTRFAHPFSTAPWTLPSHASLLTGRYPHDLSADWLTPLDRRAPTLAEVFSNRGYRTGAFVANVGYLSWEFGLERGFAHYHDFPISPRVILACTAVGRQLDRSLRLRRLIGSDQHLVRIGAPAISRAFLRWVDRSPGRPFFAFLNYYDAHDPYLPPPPYDRRFSGTPRPNNLSPLHRYLAHPSKVLPSPATVAAEIDQYDGALAYLDHELGRLFAELGRRGLLQNTVVLITADHGEEFGEHGVFDHGNSLYRPSVEVPLLVVYPPRVPAAVTVNRPVSLRDVAATLVDLAGFDQGSPIPGASLARFWQGGTTGSDSPVLSEVSRGIRTPAWYPVSRGNMQSLVALGYRYIRNDGGGEELFDAGHDPAERADLAGADSSRAALEKLRGLLQHALRTH